MPSGSEPTMPTIATTSVTRRPPQSGVSTGSQRRNRCAARRRRQHADCGNSVAPIRATRRPPRYTGKERDRCEHIRQLEAAAPKATEPCRPTASAAMSTRSRDRPQRRGPHRRRGSSVARPEQRGQPHRKNPSATTAGSAGRDVEIAAGEQDQGDQREGESR